MHCACRFFVKKLGCATRQGAWITECRPPPPKYATAINDLNCPTAADISFSFPFLSRPKLQTTQRLNNQLNTRHTIIMHLLMPKFITDTNKNTQETGTENLRMLCWLFQLRTWCSLLFVHILNRKLPYTLNDPSTDVRRAIKLTVVGVTAQR